MRRQRGHVVGLGIVTALALVSARGIEAHKAITSKYTYNDDVFPILRDKCGSCHIDGGAAPMSLMTYSVPSGAVAWAESIRENLVAEAMPPWYADPEGPAVRGGHALSPRELDVVLTWATGGTPQGDLRKSPAPFSLHLDWPLGKPDVTLDLPNETTLGPGKMETTADFTVASRFTEAKWVKAVDLLPSTPSIVRSAMVAVEHGPLLALWEPGGDRVGTSAGTAFKVPAGANLLIHIRYKKSYVDEQETKTDRSRLGIYFAGASPLPREIESSSVAGPAAGTVIGSPSKFSAKFERAGRVVALRPSVDKAYASLAVDALSPSGNRTSLLRLRGIRPEWPRRYWLTDPIDVPAGATIEVSGIPGDPDSGPLAAPVKSSLSRSTSSPSEEYVGDRSRRFLTVSAQARWIMKHSGCWLLVACVAFVPLTARAEPPGAPSSSAQAKQLCQLMAAGHLDAIAAQDPGNANHFVAALFYPDAELLVVSAQFNVPQVLQALIASKSYRDVYADLQSAQGASNQVFFIDMKADGLSDGHGAGIDVMYEPGNKQTIFDEDWRKQRGLGEREYQEKYRAAEQLYESLLHTLNGALASPLVSR